MISSAVYMSRSYAAQYKPDMPAVLISIGDPGSRIPDFGGAYQAIERLEFQDFATDTGEGAAPTKAHALRIASFVRHFHASPQKVQLVVHCKAGTSRSAAVCAWVAEQFNVQVRGLPSDIGFRLANPLLLSLLRHSSSSTTCCSPSSEKIDYATLVKRLDKDLGVKVGEVPTTPRPNPYLVSSAVIKKALQRVGVLTRSGKLSPRLK